MQARIDRAAEPQRTHVTRFGTGRLVLALATVAVLVLAGCGSSASDGGSDGDAKNDDATTTTTEAVPAANPDVSGKAFTSTSVEGHELVDGTTIDMAFDGDRLSVNAGCNSLGSAYSWTDDTLMWVGVPMATMMACDEPLMEQDTWITELLTAGVQAELADDVLTLTSGDVVITLEAVADASLTGTTWTLDGTIENDAVSSLPADVTAPTLTIADDGTAQITGCNNGSTTVEIAQDTLTFGPIAMTRMACEGTQGDLENQVLAVLDGEVEYIDAGDTLTLTNGDVGLMYKAGS